MAKQLLVCSVCTADAVEKRIGGQLPGVRIEIGNARSRAKCGKCGKDISRVAVCSELLTEGEVITDRLFVI